MSFFVFIYAFAGD